MSRGYKVMGLQGYRTDRPWLAGTPVMWNLCTMVGMMVNERGGLLADLMQAGAEPCRAFAWERLGHYSLEQFAAWIADPRQWQTMFYSPLANHQKLVSELLKLPSAPIRDARLAHCWSRLGEVNAAMAVIKNAKWHPLVDAMRCMHKSGRKDWAGILEIALPDYSELDLAQNEARCRVAYFYGAAYWGINKHLRSHYYATIAEEMARVCGLMDYARECERFRRENEGLIDKTSAFLPIIEAENAIESKIGVEALGGYFGLAGLELQRGNYEIALEAINQLPSGWQEHRAADADFCRLFLGQAATSNTIVDNETAQWIEIWVHGDDKNLPRNTNVSCGSQRLAVVVRLAQIWAYSQQHPVIAARLRSELFIDPKQWDLRLMSAMIGIEILFKDTTLVSATSSHLIDEVLELCGDSDYFSSDSPLLEMFVRNVPGAVYFIAKTAKAPEPLRYLADSVVLVGETGVFVNGELRGRAPMAAALLENTMLASSEATRSARHRAKKLLEGRRWVDARAVRSLFVAFANHSEPITRRYWLDQAQIVASQCCMQAEEFTNYANFLIK
jgi:hypothetical protein